MWKGKGWKDEMKEVILVGSLGWMVEILSFLDLILLCFSYNSYCIIYIIDKGVSFA